jgi:hypothetical protein
MKFNSPVYSAVSGSVAGLTYSHNRGGMYVRARAVPTNPNTDPQRAARDAMANAVVAWSALTDVQRSTWEDYAANVPMLDRLGNSRPLTGQQQFIRTFTARAAAGLLTATTNAPTTFNLGEWTPFSASGSAATDEISVSFNDSDAWATTVDGFATIALGIQQNGSRNFYKTPFAIKEILLGALVAPLEPADIAYGAPLLAGNKVWVRYVIGQPDGRISTPNIIEAVVGA